MSPSPGSRDLYEVLGVARDATQTDLKKAYRQLALRYHPDKCPNDKSAENIFKEAANAYQVLSDVEQRAAYDRNGLDGIRRGGGAGGSSSTGFGGFEKVEDIFSAFGDLFGDFFTGRMRDRHQPRGTDLRLELPLQFHEAVWGTRKDVKITRSVGCTPCGGLGTARGVKAEMCRQCQGRGHVVHAQGFFMVQTSCTQCHGGGKMIKDPCDVCQGRGIKSETAVLTMLVPDGMDDGQTLRLPGKGDSSPGGVPGDLFVTLRVEGDPRFRREGFDVTSKVSISFVKAALGGEIEIDTLDDSCKGTAILELAPGTCPGDIAVRRGQGVPHRGRGRGDHLIEFTIEVPKKLSSKQEKLLREFALESGEDKKHRRKRG